MKGFFTALAIAALASTTAKAAISFVPGHYYGTDWRTLDITEFAPTGTALGSLSIPGTSSQNLRGSQFGPDGLLYVTLATGGGGAFSVLALDSAGSIHQTYNAFGGLSLTVASGNLAMAPDGDTFYVAAGNNVVKFSRRNPASSSNIYSYLTTGSLITGVAIMPTGNLLVAYQNGIDEITPDGTKVRSIPSASGTSSVFFGGIVGMEYDGASNSLYVSSWNTGAQHYQVAKLDAATGVVQSSISVTDPGDLFLTDTGLLVVGTRTNAPQVYNSSWQSIATLGTTNQYFVTQMPVPEPTTSLLLAGGFTWVLSSRHRRGKRGS